MYVLHRFWDLFNLGYPSFLPSCVVDELRFILNPTDRVQTRQDRTGFYNEPRPVATPLLPHVTFLRRILPLCPSQSLRELSNFIPSRHGDHQHSSCAQPNIHTTMVTSIRIFGGLLALALPTTIALAVPTTPTSPSHLITLSSSDTERRVLSLTSARASLDDAASQEAATAILAAPPGPVLVSSLDIPQVERRVLNLTSTQSALKDATQQNATSEEAKILPYDPHDPVIVGGHDLITTPNRRDVLAAKAEMEEAIEHNDALVEGKKKSRKLRKVEDKEAETAQKFAKKESKAENERAKSHKKDEKKRRLHLSWTKKKAWYRQRAYDAMKEAEQKEGRSPDRLKYVTYSDELFDRHYRTCRGRAIYHCAWTMEGMEKYNDSKDSWQVEGSIVCSLFFYVSLALDGICCILVWVSPPLLKQNGTSGGVGRAIVLAEDRPH